MKKKYIIYLTIIGLFLFASLTLATGYGLWLANQDDNETKSTKNDCFEIYYNNENIFQMKNIKPLSEDAGKRTSPYTLTITNICKEKKKLELRLNILNTTTISLNGLIIEAEGNINLDQNFYNDLKTAKTDNKEAVKSKIVGSIEIKPEETIRSNIRLWFDEKKTFNYRKEDIFAATFEIIDKEKAPKATIYENIMTLYDTTEKLTELNTNSSLYKNDNNYILRGNIQNNYLSFADLTWRIVGINEDKSLKIILQNATDFKSYNSKTNYKYLLGFKYMNYNKTINNEINNYLLQWYNDKIITKNYDKYVYDYNFCNDTKSETKNNHTYFAAYNRLIATSKPTLTCSKTNEPFGGIYKQKIGLITADEAYIAGATTEPNKNYYLYNGQNFYTMTPSEYYNYKAYIFTITDNGILKSNTLNTNLGIRPVININSSLTYKGEGTIDNPYTLNLE